jgi:hypothetical protein
VVWEPNTRNCTLTLYQRDRFHIRITMAKSGYKKDTEVQLLLYPCLSCLNECLTKTERFSKNPMYHVCTMPDIKMVIISCSWFMRKLMTWWTELLDSQYIVFRRSILFIANRWCLSDRWKEEIHKGLAQVFYSTNSNSWSSLQADSHCYKIYLQQQNMLWRFN